jgi:hypothetical protein
MKKNNGYSQRLRLSTSASDNSKRQQEEEIEWKVLIG